MHFERHFTLAEARALLPELRRAFARIHALLDDAQKRDNERGPAVTFFSANGHGPRIEANEESGPVAAIQRIIDELHGRGIQIKDLRRGLVDFPCLLPPDNQEVFLCWELSEPDIAYWHRLEDGYTGRAPLNE